MSGQDAGAAIAYLQNSSPDRGSSGAEDARPRTEASDLTSSLSALSDRSKSVFPVRCHVAIVLRQLSDADREVLERLIDVPRMDGTMAPATQIAGVLREAGFHVNAPSIRRHRRRVVGHRDCCTCG